MSIITKVLKTKVVYWSPSSIACNGRQKYDDFGNVVMEDPPVELAARWDDKREEVISEEGTKVVSNSQVMLSADVEIGGFLFLGSLETASRFRGNEFFDPRGRGDVYEIVKFDKIPNIK
jgi:hypothetical protein